MVDDFKDDLLEEEALEGEKPEADPEEDESFDELLEKEFSETDEEEDGY